MYKDIKIENIRDVYQINEFGEIRNKFSNKQLKPFVRSKTQRQNYLSIILKTNDGKNKTFSIHRLIMMTFHPREDMDNLFVNHIDGNKLNNNITNLEWTTAKGNTQHALVNDLMNTKITKNEVIKICKYIEKGLSNRIIAELMFSNPDDYYYSINNIRNGKSWKEITKDYNLKTPLKYGNFRKSNFSFKEILSVCKLIPKSKNDKLIAQKIFGDNFEDKHRMLVYDIRRKNIYKEISKHYF